MDCNKWRGAKKEENTIYKKNWPRFFIFEKFLSKIGEKFQICYTKNGL